MQWTCFIAVGSMDFVSFPRTAILPGLPPAFVSKESTFSGSVSRKPRRVSGRPVEGSCTPRTCLPVLRAVKMLPQLQNRFTPQRSHAHYYEGHHADGKRRRVGAFGGSWKTTGEPSFRLRSQNFRLSQAKRSGTKDKFVRNRSSKRGLHAHSHKVRCRIPFEIEDRCDMRKSRLK